MSLKATPGQRGAGPASDENYFAVQASWVQPPRAVLGDGQGPVGGDRGNAQACAEVEPGLLRQRKDPLGRQDGELLRCPAVGALVGGQGESNRHEEQALKQAAA